MNSVCGRMICYIVSFSINLCKIHMKKMHKTSIENILYNHHHFVTLLSCKDSDKHLLFCCFIFLEWSPLSLLQVCVLYLAMDMARNPNRSFISLHINICQEIKSIYISYLEIAMHYNFIKINENDYLKYILYQ